MLDNFEFISPDNNGDYFENYQDALLAARGLDPESPERHMWTITEGERDTLWASEGVRFVNSMHMWCVSKQSHEFGGHDFLWCAESLKRDYRNAARDMHDEAGYIEIDDPNAEVRISEEGCFVQAWVWVSAAEMELFRENDKSASLSEEV